MGNAMRIAKLLSESKIFVLMDTLIPAKKSTTRPIYFRGVLPVELAAELTLARRCARSIANAFLIIVNSYGLPAPSSQPGFCPTCACNRNSVGDSPVFFLKTELK